MPPKKKPAKKPAKKPVRPSQKRPAISVHYPKGKEHLYPKSHPKYKPKKE